MAVMSTFTTVIGNYIVKPASPMYVCVRACTVLVIVSVIAFCEIPDTFFGLYFNTYICFVRRDKQNMFVIYILVNTFLFKPKGFLDN